MMGTTCAFTGHRPHKLPWKANENDPRCLELKALLAEQIAALSTAGITEYFCGMAEGTDLYCAKIVPTMREKNSAPKFRCLLPHEGQADRWIDSAWERYFSILKQADSVDYVSRQYYDGCIIDRNHRLVESAGLLLAGFNGVRRSGTGATVNYAQRLGRKVIVIDPITRHITCEETAPLLI